MTLHETIGADGLHDLGVDGRGVGVAVIDTGVSPVNALRGRVRQGIDLSGVGSTEDAYGHGTAVAGLIAGGLIGNRPIGVAPGAHIVPVRVAGPDGATDVSNVLAALQWAVSFADEFDVRVVTLAMGTDAGTSWRRDILNRAVQRAREAGLVVVTSVGNRGPERGTVAKPADDPGALSVGAAGRSGSLDPGGGGSATFSSRGPTSDGGVPKPDVLAPGVDVTTLRVPGSIVDRSFPNSAIDHQRVRASGASFAMATVAGAVALGLQQRPDWTAEQVQAALLSTAARRSSGDSGAVGHGVIDVGAAAAIEAVEPEVKRSSEARGEVEPLGASRGSLTVAIGPAEDPTVLDARSPLTAQGRPFEAEAYLQGDWTDPAWETSQWAGHDWAVPRWHRRTHEQEWYAVAWG